MPRPELNSKPDLRAQFRLARRQIPPHERAQSSARIAQHALAWLDLQSPKPRAVAIYLATPAEANLDALTEPLRARGILVAAPKDDGFALVEPASTCGEPGAQSWREAGGEPIGVEGIDIIFLPGVAFGRDGTRLGQGGGWYDRALQSSEATLVGVGFGCQITDSLPVEPHDVAVQWIACESGFVRAV